MMHGQPCPCTGQAQTPPGAWVLAKDLIVFADPKLGLKASTLIPKWGWP